MKGISFRRPLDHNSARIVQSIADSYSDQIIPLSLALELFLKGKLVPIFVGRDYPNSYRRI